MVQRWVRDCCGVGYVVVQGGEREGVVVGYAVEQDVEMEGVAVAYVVEQRLVRGKVLLLDMMWCRGW